MKAKFNYIVPIFNKEDVLPLTLEGIDNCASNDSDIFLVVDGCTDKSEAIVDEFIKNSSLRVYKILMPNVHMLLSVNAALRNIKKGYSIIMQDDIILKDVDAEIKIKDLYDRMKGKLGVTSFRYGSNIKPAPLKTKLANKTFKGMISEVDFIKGPSDYANYSQGEFGKFYPRMSAINGPNCIPWEILNNVGLLDEKLAPFGFDDPEYCLRTLKLGYINGLFPIEYKSDLDWGGTRRNTSFSIQAPKVHKRNRIYIYKKHEKFLKDYIKNNKIYSDLEFI